MKVGVWVDSKFINWLGDSDLKEKNVIEIIESLKNI